MSLEVWRIVLYCVQYNPWNLLKWNPQKQLKTPSDRIRSHLSTKEITHSRSILIQKFLLQQVAPAVLPKANHSCRTILATLFLQMETSHYMTTCHVKPEIYLELSNNIGSKTKCRLPAKNELCGLPYLNRILEKVWFYCHGQQRKRLQGSQVTFG